MSRAAALALRKERQEREFSELNEFLGDEEKIMAAFEREEGQRIAHAKNGLAQLLRHLGIAVSEHDFYVLDDFLAYAPHERVCVDFVGRRLNYVRSHGNHPSFVQILAGRCSNCGEVPYRIRLNSFGDLGKPQQPYIHRAAKLWLCDDCSRGARAS